MMLDHTTWGAGNGPGLAQICHPPALWPLSELATGSKWAEEESGGILVVCWSSANNPCGLVLRMNPV